MKVILLIIGCIGLAPMSFQTNYNRQFDTVGANVPYSIADALTQVADIPKTKMPDGENGANGLNSAGQSGLDGADGGDGASGTPYSSTLTGSQSLFVIAGSGGDVGSGGDGASGNPRGGAGGNGGLGGNGGDVALKVCNGIGYVMAGDGGVGGAGGKGGDGFGNIPSQTPHGGNGGNGGKSGDAGKAEVWIVSGYSGTGVSIGGLPGGVTGNSVSPAPGGQAGVREGAPGQSGAIGAMNHVGASWVPNNGDC